MKIKKVAQYINGGASLSNVYGTSDNNGYTQEYINDKIVNVGTEVDSSFRTNILYSTNLFDKNTITSNYYYDDSGNYTFLNGICVSDYIEVQPNKVYKLESADIGTYTRRINFFDSSKQWLSQQYAIRTNFKIVIPNDCKYVRISGNSNLLNNTFIFKTNPIMIVDNEEGYNTNEMYSNSEIVVGTWIDGKPLYRKVIRGNFSTHNEGSIWYETHSGVSSDLNTIVDIKAIMNNQHSILYYKNTSNDYFIKTYRQGTGFEFAGNRAMTTSDTYIVTLEYTKTTD